jgi:propionyl-CoA carboxylase beta chain
MFLTGPEVIREVTHENVTKEGLGGPGVHAAKSGLCHLLARDDREGIQLVRELLSFLPSNNMEDPPYYPTGDPVDRKEGALKTMVPVDANKPYDIKSIRMISNPLSTWWWMTVTFLKSMGIMPPILSWDLPGWGEGLWVLLPISPITWPGAWISLPRKKGRGLCGFAMPLIFPWWYFMIPRVFFRVWTRSTAVLSVRVTIITRKAYGGAYLVMSSKHIRGDINLAYPLAEIAIMGAKGAANIIFRKEIASAANPEKKRQELVEKYRKTYSNAYRAAELGYIDGIIFPEDTRRHIIRSLEMLKNKRQGNPPKKHGNIPL